MFERARPFVEEVMAREERVIAIVSHGMIGKVMASIVLGLWGDETLAIFQPNDAVFRVRTGPEGHEVHHWRGGVGPVDGFTRREG
jgi:broad specificity phosphatase PhoE